MKKLFGSLMLGFGAALGVFVALAMPPGGWGVAVGVSLGLLGCLPLLLIMMMLVGRGHTGRRNQVHGESQPVIIIQQPTGYDPYGYDHYAVPAQSHGHGYLSEPDYYEPVRQRRLRPEVTQEYDRLPSARRQSQYPAYFQPEMAYPAQDYYGGDYYEQPEEEAYYYATPQPQPTHFDAYYGPRTAQPLAYSAEYEAPERFQAAPARRSMRGPSRREEAVEAEYRTIGDSD
ncbi:MAG: hypothetical protein JWP00_1108 [Chloroflexi bacterium]|nr:hypothetical protein [Chloroflexota bacterium]